MRDELGGWRSRTSALKLSDGCEKVAYAWRRKDLYFKHVDYNKCVWTADGFAGSGHALLNDRHNDNLCMMRVYAKRAAQNRRLSEEVQRDAGRLGEVGTGSVNVSERLQPEHPATKSRSGALPWRRLAGVDTSRFIKNIGKAMYGYNHYFGAPFSVQNAGTDPGFVHRSLWEDVYSAGNSAILSEFKEIPGLQKGAARRLGSNATSGRRLVAGQPRSLAEAGKKVPDGWKVTLGRSTYCENDFSTTEISSQFDYDEENHNSFSFGGSIDFFSFGMSSESHHFMRKNGKESKRLVTTKAECIDYIAEIQDLANNPPPTNPSFKYVVDATESEEEFHILFDLFGLHFPTKLVFGSRYGYTRYIDQQKYKKLATEMHSTTVSFGVSYTVGVDKGHASAGVTASAELARTFKDEYKTSASLTKFFEETREFWIGKRMPDKGGVAEWIKASSEEPMPIRYDLKSICDHPAFAGGKRQTCHQHASTYCTKHLDGLTELECTAAKKPECQWDLDCEGNHMICDQGSCMKEPGCEVTVYDDNHFRGANQKFGPYYRRQYPLGYTFSVGGWQGRASSLLMSGGCEEVIAVSAWKCQERHKDNEVYTAKSSNDPIRAGGLKWGLNDNLCKLHVLPKERWV
jgi:hypothetical protein